MRQVETVVLGARNHESNPFDSADATDEHRCVHVSAQNGSSGLGASLTSGGRGMPSKSVRVALAAVGGVLAKCELEKAVPGGRGGST